MSDGHDKIPATDDSGTADNGSRGPAAGDQTVGDQAASDSAERDNAARDGEIAHGTTGESAVSDTTNDAKQSTPQMVASVNLARTTGSFDKPVKSNNTIVWVLLSSLVTGVVCLYLGSTMPRTQESRSGIAASLGNGKALSLGKAEAAHFLADTTIAEIVDATMPAVVSLNLEPILPSEMQPQLNLSGEAKVVPFAPFFKRSIGAGLIIRDDGYILTSAHVIKPHMHIKITLSDSRVFEGRLIGKDSFTDLALVKIDAQHLPVAHFGESKNVRVGEWIIAIGSPLGLDRTVTFGIVSALGRSLDEINNHVELIQTDAAINPGSSGGPLLNTRGEVIALSSYVRNDAQNISFAVPIDAARDVAAILIENQGTLKRPYIGIHMQDMNEYFAAQIGSKVKEGAMVSAVVPGSPCEKAGIGQYDVITMVNERAVKTAKEVREIVRESKPGDVIEITFVRHTNAPEKRKIAVGDYPEE